MHVIYIPVKLKDKTWLLVVALAIISIAVWTRGASSAVVRGNNVAISAKLATLCLMLIMSVCDSVHL